MTDRERINRILKIESRFINRKAQLIIAELAGIATRALDNSVAEFPPNILAVQKDQYDEMIDWQRRALDRLLSMRCHSCSDRCFYAQSGNCLTYRLIKEATPLGQIR
ncbi:MAG: hypothetical protein N2491_01780 [Negativicutes bacterium]|nr:hypothetical protein [Negativicutes bacterium]